MALDATQVRIASNGKILVAPVGTAAPVDTTTAFAASWVNLGYASEDGVTLTPSLDTDDIPGWQSSAPLRTIITGAGLEVGFTLMQSSPEVLDLYFGGTTAAGTLEVPVSPSITERSLAVEWIDGASVYRLIVPRAALTDRGEITLARGDAVAFEMTFAAMPPATGNALATVLGVV